MPINPDLQNAVQNMSVNDIKEIILSGKFKYGEDFTIDAPEKRKVIENWLSTLPKPVDPREKEEWDSIVPLLASSDLETLGLRLKGYVEHWSVIRPAGNHLDEAQAKLTEIDGLIKKKQEQKEQNEWEELDKTSVTRMMDYINRWPTSVHRDDIDDMVWNICLKRNRVGNYINYFPNGKHIAEADNIGSYSIEWDKVKVSRDIFVVKNYVAKYPESPFAEEAKKRLAQLKEELVKTMKTKPSSVDRDQLLRLINEKVFTDSELMNSGVMSEKAMAIMRRYSVIKSELPDLNSLIRKRLSDPPQECTDVYLFGIPSSGKTCVLMGLVAANGEIDVNLKRANGDYAAGLQQWIKEGLLPDSTPSVVATVNAIIRHGRHSHPINLVEMSGEEFAYKLAHGQNVVLADMGNGVPALLTNSNRKVFFFIIDPTSETVNSTLITQKTEKQWDETTGTYYDVAVDEVQETYRVSQSQTLKKMMDLLTLEENAAVLEKVDAIHIIVTKADNLADVHSQRLEAARDHFNTHYPKLLAPILAAHARHSQINSGTDGHPRLYTYSLGRFYPGGIFEYDAKESDRITNVIANNSRGKTEGTSFWSKFRAKVNAPKTK